MNVRRYGVVLTGMVLAVTATIAGCGTRTSPLVKDRAARGRATQSAPVTATPVADTSCADPTASLRPPAVMPKPGAMPAGSFMATIAARGRLIVGTSQDTLLFSSRNPFTGNIEGFDIDTARLVAKAIFGDPNKLQIVVIPNSARIPDVQNNTVDLVAETMTVNCDRDKLVDFSTVYYDAGQKILVPITSTATSLADLGGKTVCAAAGATSIDAIKAAPSHPKLLTEPSWGDCLVAFQENRADAISTDDTILDGLAAQDPYAKVVGPRFTDEPYGLAISKSHPDFTRFVNGVLAAERADGTWAQLFKHWLGKFAPAQQPPVAHYRD
jgi:polar amino acid transport system substrate-binding protein